MSEPGNAAWKPWRVEHVVDASGPAFALRTYLEQRDVRSFLQLVQRHAPLDAAAEVGCGYGRMIVVLGEFARQVVGFERQPEFVDIARRLHPGFVFHQVPTLAALPAPARSFDLVCCHTVLQHLTDRALASAAAEIKRILRPGGFLLACEDTNPAARFGDVDDDRGMCVVGRPVAAYESAFAPLRLAATAPRRVEPTYPHPDVGSYLLFQG